jgi:hypothetical protein
LAAPTAPTLNSIVVEGLKKAGIPNPESGQNAGLLTRAKDEWMAEIKGAIFGLIKDPKFLQTTAVMITTEGKERYALPTDFEKAIDLTLLDGTNTGTAQGGSTSSVTLAATETMTEAQLLGRNLLIYEGTGIGSMSPCTAYNSSTKVASVNPDLNTAPVSGDKYIRVDSFSPLPFKHIVKKNEQYRSTERGTPNRVFIVGDADNGEIEIDPIPYRTSSLPWGVQLRYYVDLQRVDLASTLMTTLYRRWRNIFLQGIKAKKLKDDDDDRADTEWNEYKGLLRDLQARETYGMDLSNMQMTIGD